jgi:uncharacterized protein (DUF433 family)
LVQAEIRDRPAYMVYAENRHPQEKPAMTAIGIPDEQAAAQGYTVEVWLKKLAEGGTGGFAMAALDWSQCPAVESVPGKVSGAWIFRDTRMPVSAVFENPEDGLTIDDLIQLYDGLTRDQAEAVLDFAARRLETPVTAHHRQ